ncbi:MAG: laccase domain-containing protein [Desulfovibrio sp.]|nr:laccase domain-containing protein [Desulfovibrio sp.]
MSVAFISFRFPGIDRVRCAFQTRCAADDPYAGGNISFSVGDRAYMVTAHRQALLEKLYSQGVQAWAELHQVHGDSLVYEPEGIPCEVSPTVEGDGMATERPGLGLFIKTADCQPILLAHRSGRYVAALHVGWRGNRCAFPVSGVSRFCEHYGLRASDILAVRGPSLGPARAEFVNFEQEWSEAFRPWFDTATRTMDLWSLTRYQLQQAGIPERQIYGLDLCTYSNDNAFFSYRRSRQTGRQGSLIWIRS